MQLGPVGSYSSCFGSEFIRSSTVLMRFVFFGNFSRINLNSDSIILDLFVAYVDLQSHTPSSNLDFDLFLQLLKMAQERIWTEEEDEALRYLFEEEKIRKWSYLAQRLTQYYRIRGLTGKKCKKRYLELVPSHEAEGLHTSMDLNEDAEINRLHDLVGNKWSTISRKMNEEGKRDIQRTDNSVKNFFYSKLRKSLRKVNKAIENLYDGEKKPLKENTIYKIVEITDQRFKRQSIVSKETIGLSMKMKTWLYNFLDYEGENMMSEAQQFYEEANDFLLSFKKDAKKPSKNNGSSEEAERASKKVNLPKLEKISRKKNMFWEDLQEEHSIEISIEDEAEQIFNDPRVKEEEENGIRLSFNCVNDMLEKAGILKEEYVEDVKMEEWEQREEEPRNSFLNNSFENFRLPLLRSHSLNSSFLLFTSS